jgi:hypothetical protein
MSANMSVVFISHTGHVVGAVRQAVTAGKVEIAALVGSELPLRNLISSAAPDNLPVRAPAKILDVKTVPLDEAVLANPQAYVVNGDHVAELPATPTLSSVTLDASRTTVTLPAAPPEPINVLTLVFGRIGNTDVLRAQSGKTAASATALDLALTLLPGSTVATVPAGDYAVCAAAAGRRLLFAAQTV